MRHFLLCLTLALLSFVAGRASAETLLSVDLMDNQYPDRLKALKTTAEVRLETEGTSRTLQVLFSIHNESDSPVVILDPAATHGVTLRREGSALFRSWVLKNGPHYYSSKGRPAKRSAERPLRNKGEEKRTPRPLIKEIGASAFGGWSDRELRPLQMHRDGEDFVEIAPDETYVVEVNIGALHRDGLLIPIESGEYRLRLAMPLILHEGDPSDHSHRYSRPGLLDLYIP